MKKETDNSNAGGKWKITALHRELEMMEANTTISESGDMDQFSGYGIMGLSFCSGHVLALRRYTHSDIGPGFSAIWHRDPEGIWTFYSDVEAEWSCSRYYGNKVHYSVKTTIELSWSDPYTLIASMPEENFRWEIRLKENGVSMFINRLLKFIPAAWLKNKWLIQWAGRLSGMITGAGKINLTGHTTNRQFYMARPHSIMMVAESNASKDGISFGVPGALNSQVALGDFYIPDKGLFLIGVVMMEKFQADKHSAKTSIRKAIPAGSKVNNLSEK